MRRRYVTVGLFLIAAVLFLVWRIGYHGQDPRLIFSPPPEVAFIPPAALEEPSAIDVSNIPLRDALAALSKKHRVRIDLDDFALKDAFVTGDEPVTLKCRGVRLKSVLEELVRDFGFVVRYRDGTIHVTSTTAWDDRQQNFLARVYRLDRLLAAPLRPVDEETLVDIITANLSPNTWEDAGGSGIIRTVPGGIVVSHLPEVHEEITALFDRLAEVFEMLDPPVRMPLHAVQQTNGSIESALQELTEINVAEIPFKDVCAELARRHGIAILFDSKALDGVGLSDNELVTCKLRGISLRSALAVLLKRLELTIMIKNDVLMITTPEVADTALSTCLYPVADLASSSNGADYDTLIDLITTTVAPTTWEDSGGAGGIEGFGGVLVISQKEDVHEQIESLLIDLRQARYPSALGMASRNIPPGNERLERALSRPISFQFEQVPLRAAAARLSDLSGINVLLETKALDGIGVHDDLPISFQAEEIPLERAVRQMLAKHNLAPRVHWECLFFSTPEMATYPIETHCYRVGNMLTTARLVASLAHNDWDSLIDFMTSVADPASWSEVGGAGSVTPFENVLVISQTRACHATIVALLDQIRRLSREPHSGAAVEASSGLTGDSPSLWLYDVRDLSPLQVAGDKSMAEALRDSLAPEVEYGRRKEPRRVGFAQYGYLVAVWGEPSIQRRTQELLVAVRRVTPESVSTTPTLSAKDAGGRLSAVFPVADLRRAAGWRKAPLTAADAAQGFFQRMQGIPLAKYDPWPPARNDPFARIVNDSLNLSLFERDFPFGFALLGDLLIVDGTAVERNQVERFLTNLRQLLIERSPQGELLADSPGETSIISVRDLRPVLNRFSELDERQIGEFVQRAAKKTPSPTNSHSKPFLIRVLPRSLVFSDPFSAAKIDQALEMLLGDLAEFPRPCELARDDDRPAQLRLAECIGREQDELRLVWLLWLSEQAREATPELAAAIKRRNDDKVDALIEEILQH